MFLYMSGCVPVVPVALLFCSMGSAQVGKEGVLLDPPHVDTRSRLL